jgi:hypothetical protein
VDYAKVDASLAAALAATGASDARTGAERLTVFVHLADDVGPAEREALAGLGLDPAGDPEAATTTATLTPAQVAALSERPSVRRIQLSERLRLRQGPAST